MEFKNDYIISTGCSEEYAFLEIKKNLEIQYFYNAVILKNKFPKELIFLIQEYNECIDGFFFSLIDHLI